MSKKAIWNMEIGFAGLVYVVVDLCQNIQSPLFAVLFVLVAGDEVIGSHTSRHKILTAVVAHPVNATERRAQTPRDCQCTLDQPLAGI